MPRRSGGYALNVGTAKDGVVLVDEHLDTFWMLSPSSARDMADALYMAAGIHEGTIRPEETE